MICSTECLWGKSLRNRSCLRKLYWFSGVTAGSTSNDSNISANLESYTKTLWGVKQWPGEDVRRKNRGQKYCETVPLTSSVHHGLSYLTYCTFSLQLYLLLCVQTSLQKPAHLPGKQVGLFCTQLAKYIYLQLSFQLPKQTLHIFSLNLFPLSFVYL